MKEDLKRATESHVKNSLKTVLSSIMECKVWSGLIYLEENPKELGETIKNKLISAAWTLKVIEKNEDRKKAAWKNLKLLDLIGEEADFFQTSYPELINSVNLSLTNIIGDYYTEEGFDFFI